MTATRKKIEEKMSLETSLGRSSLFENYLWKSPKRHAQRMLKTMALWLTWNSTSAFADGVDRRHGNPENDELSSSSKPYNELRYGREVSILRQNELKLEVDDAELEEMGRKAQHKRKLVQEGLYEIVENGIDDRIENRLSHRIEDTVDGRIGGGAPDEVRKELPRDLTIAIDLADDDDVFGLRGMVRSLSDISWNYSNITDEDVNGTNDTNGSNMTGLQSLLGDDDDATSTSTTTVATVVQTTSTTTTAPMVDFGIDFDNSTNATEEPCEFQNVTVCEPLMQTICIVVYGTTENTTINGIPLADLERVNKDGSKIDTGERDGGGPDENRLLEEDGSQESGEGRQAGAVRRRILLEEYTEGNDEVVVLGDGIMGRRVLRSPRKTNLRRRLQEAEETRHILIEPRRKDGTSGTSNPFSKDDFFLESDGTSLVMQNRDEDGEKMTRNLYSVDFRQYLIDQIEDQYGFTPGDALIKRILSSQDHIAGLFHQVDAKQRELVKEGLEDDMTRDDAVMTFSKDAFTSTNGWHVNPFTNGNSQTSEASQDLNVISRNLLESGLDPSIVNDPAKFANAIGANANSVSIRTSVSNDAIFAGGIRPARAISNPAENFGMEFADFMRLSLLPALFTSFIPTTAISSNDIPQEGSERCPILNPFFLDFVKGIESSSENGLVNLGVNEVESSAPKSSAPNFSLYILPDVAGSSTDDALNAVLNAVFSDKNRLLRGDTNLYSRGEPRLLYDPSVDDSIYAMSSVTTLHLNNFGNILSRQCFRSKIPLAERIGAEVTGDPHQSYSNALARVLDDEAVRNGLTPVTMKEESASNDMILSDISVGDLASGDITTDCSQAQAKNGDSNSDEKSKKRQKDVVYEHSAEYEFRNPPEYKRSLPEDGEDGDDIADVVQDLRSLLEIENANDTNGTFDGNGTNFTDFKNTTSNELCVSVKIGQVCRWMMKCLPTTTTTTTTTEFWFMNYPVFQPSTTTSTTTTSTTSTTSEPPANTTTIPFITTNRPIFVTLERTTTPEPTTTLPTTTDPPTTTTTTVVTFDPAESVLHVEGSYNAIERWPFEVPDFAITNDRGYREAKRMGLAKPLGINPRNVEILNITFIGNYIPPPPPPSYNRKLTNAWGDIVNSIQMTQTGGVSFDQVLPANNIGVGSSSRVVVYGSKNSETHGGSTSTNDDNTRPRSSARNTVNPARKGTSLTNYLNRHFYDDGYGEVAFRIAPEKIPAYSGTAASAEWAYIGSNVDRSATGQVAVDGSRSLGAINAGSNSAGVDALRRSTGVGASVLTAYNTLDDSRKLQTLTIQVEIKTEYRVSIREQDVHDMIIKVLTKRIEASVIDSFSNSTAAPAKSLPQYSSVITTLLADLPTMRSWVDRMEKEFLYMPKYQRNRKNDYMLSELSNPPMIPPVEFNAGAKSIAKKLDENKLSTAIQVATNDAFQQIATSNVFLYGPPVFEMPPVVVVDKLGGNAALITSTTTEAPTTTTVNMTETNTTAPAMESKTEDDNEMIMIGMFCVGGLIVCGGGIGMLRHYHKKGLLDKKKIAAGMARSISKGSAAFSNSLTSFARSFGLAKEEKYESKIEIESESDHGPKPYVKKKKYDPNDPPPPPDFPPGFDIAVVKGISTPRYDKKTSVYYSPTLLQEANRIQEAYRKTGLIQAHLWSPTLMAYVAGDSADKDIYHAEEAVSLLKLGKVATSFKKTQRYTMFWRSGAAQRSRLQILKSVVRKKLHKRGPRKYTHEDDEEHHHHKEEISPELLHMPPRQSLAVRKPVSVDKLFIRMARKHAEKDRGRPSQTEQLSKKVENLHVKTPFEPPAAVVSSGMFSGGGLSSRQDCRHLSHDETVNQLSSALSELNTARKKIRKREVRVDQTSGGLFTLETPEKAAVRRSSSQVGFGSPEFKRASTGSDSIASEGASADAIPFQPAIDSVRKVETHRGEDVAQEKYTPTWKQVKHEKIVHY